MIKGAIFDLDGVIVSTDELHYKSWKKIADDEQIYFDEEINERLRGVSRLESLDIILEKASKKYDAEEKIKLATQKNEIYREYLNDLTNEDILPGITKFLNELKSYNIKLAIGSSSKNARTILNKIGLYDMFDIIVDGNDISKSKPDPEVFVKAKLGLGLGNEDYIVFEDATSGVIAANEAKCISVAVGKIWQDLNAKYGFRTVNDIDIKKLFRI